jgi:hypothetical protein
MPAYLSTIIWCSHQTRNEYEILPIRNEQKFRAEDFNACFLSIEEKNKTICII